jgi:hypothetical protein
MRPIVIGAATLLAIGCAGSPTADNSSPLDRACATDDCFYEREVRDFEVVNQTTLVVFVGNQRCPFQIELRGTFCDMSFAPDIYFDNPNEIRRDSDTDPFIGSPSSRLHDFRICSNDITVGVSGGVFTESPTNTQPPDRYGQERSDCHISSVTALTDDELVELYVSRGVVAPLPPMGTGEIEVGDQEEQGAEAPAPANDAGQPQAAEAPPSPATASSRL